MDLNPWLPTMWRTSGKDDWPASQARAVLSAEAYAARHAGVLADSPPLLLQ